MADGVDIKFKRARTYAANDYQGLPIKNRVLLEGEPIYFMEVEPNSKTGEFKKILVIGDGARTIEDLINAGLYFSTNDSLLVNIDNLINIPEDPKAFGPSINSQYPSMDGTKAAGLSNFWAREDHVHPHDDTKLDKTNGLTDITYDSITKKLTKKRTNSAETIVDLKDLWVSPELNGNPTTPTAIPADLTNNPNKIANITYVQQLLDNKSIRETKQPKTSGTIYVTGVATADGELFYNTTGNPGTYGVRIDCDKGVLKGSAWNDIAEYREGDNIPGKVVCESEDGTVRLSTKRLQKLPYIVSDTFGFAIGETDNCKTPIAIAGRVLVHVNNPTKIHVGDAVCAGKDGNASRMTRLEQILYPDRVIGYVSEIPKYFTWNNIEINDRVWIKIK